MAPAKNGSRIKLRLGNYIRVLLSFPEWLIIVPGNQVEALEVNVSRWERRCLFPGRSVLFIFPTTGIPQITERENETEICIIFPDQVIVGCSFYSILKNDDKR